MDGEVFVRRDGVVGHASLAVEHRGRVEVISGVARRRRWSRDEKAQITAESFTPGASVSDVARRYGMSLGLLHHWRRAARSGKLDAVQSFVPLLPIEETPAAPSAGMIEIDVGGVVIRVRGPVDGAALKGVLTAVRQT